MVTAGVFMVARLSPLFELAPCALQVVTLVGAVTAFFAATVGLVQNDIKRVVAYSTCSQLGYMFVACGVGAYSAGIFHLFTHAFFKALLFLGAGSVIHAMHHEQDMRKMGGLAAKLRFTWAMMLVRHAVADGRRHPASHRALPASTPRMPSSRRPLPRTRPATTPFWLLVIAAFMTAFYSWRLIFMTFHGPTRADHETYEHAHESPLVMLVVLAALALGRGGRRLRLPDISSSATATRRSGARPCSRAGQPHPARHARGPGLGQLGGDRWRCWPALRSPTSTTSPAPSLPDLTARMFRADLPLPAQQVVLRRALRLAVRAARVLARPPAVEGRGRQASSTGSGPTASPARVLWTTGRIVKLQTGYVYHYAFAMLIGVALIITWFMFYGGAVR